MKKRIFAILLIFLLLVGCSRNSTQSEETIQPTQSAGEEDVQAPDFTVYDIDGEPVKLSDFLGTPVVLNFWASWCGPCKMEMPDFEEVYLEYGDRVQFMMVNLTDGTQETVETAAALIEKEGYTFPVYFDTTQAAAIMYGIRSIPTTFFINADGQIEGYGTGAMGRETVQQGLDLILPE